MSVEEELRAFLSRPDNLPTALEVSRHVATLRDELHAAFWPAFDNELHRRLEAAVHEPSWYVRQSDRNYQNAWASRSLAPQLALSHPDASLLMVTVEQGTPGDRFPLYYGIRWTHKHGHQTELPAYQALTAHLLRRGKELREGGWWVLIQNAGYAAEGDRFALRMAGDADAFIREMLDLPWALFTDTVELLDAFNEAVTRRET